MKKLLLSSLALLCLAALLLLSLSACGYKRTNLPTDTVCIVVKDYGTITVELYPEEAPITVANFKALVAEGFYTNKTFHRVIEGFMIQGGAPTASDEAHDSIKGEFSANGVDNKVKHTRGAISMARTNVYNSASTQFFIVHETEGAAHLDGKYAAFGMVVDGIDVVDKIAAVATNPSNDAPLRNVIISEIYFVEK